jgi:hypothetical protein
MMNPGGGPATGEKATTTTSSRTTRLSTKIKAERATEKGKEKERANQKEREKATTKEKEKQEEKDNKKVNDYQFSKLLCLTSHRFLPRHFLRGCARALFLLWLPTGTPRPHGNLLRHQPNRPSGARLSSPPRQSLRETAGGWHCILIKELFIFIPDLSTQRASPTSFQHKVGIAGTLTQKWSQKCSRQTT